MNDFFLFVRPPRPLWPFNGPGSAFWPPLAFASLAAALRAGVPGVRVGILDAPANRMGWASLAAELGRLRPSWVGIGEEAVSCIEGLRLATLAKRMGAGVVAGGCFFGHVAPEVLATRKVDVVVHGEGERTIVELVQALQSRDGRALREVRGISFLDGEEVVRTADRPLIEDLDCLPLPAYDLLPVSRYGEASRNHRSLAAIELGRGCPHACDFCVLWRQMGLRDGDRQLPQLRTKSPERLLEEVRILMDRFDRRYLGWVDPCFNAHSQVPRRLAESMLRENRSVGQSAWVRADCLARDAGSGALEACTRAGLNEAYVGIERLDPTALHALGKSSPDGQVRETLDMLDREHPGIFKVGTFIYGLPDDTPGSLRALFRQACELPLDLALFIPLTPLPGTPGWSPEAWDPTGLRFRAFSFLPHVDGDPARVRLTRTLLTAAALDWSAARLRRTLGGICSGDARRRSITCRQLARLVPFVASGLAQGLLGRNGAGGMRLPGWYES
jgi:anaerobic magnesium-protoporphyrin IX monomethyl ester cyclase